VANHEECSSNIEIQNLLEHEKDVSYKTENKANFDEVGNFMRWRAFERCIEDKHNDWEWFEQL